MRAAWTPRATLTYPLVAHAAAFLAAGTFHNNYLIRAPPLLGLYLAVTLYRPVEGSPAAASCQSDPGTSPPWRRNRVNFRT